LFQLFKTQRSLRLSRQTRCGGCACSARQVGSLLSRVKCAYLLQKRLDKTLDIEVSRSLKIKRI
jgi:hypothetical protein